MRICEVHGSGIKVVSDEGVCMDLGRGWSGAALAINIYVHAEQMACSGMTEQGKGQGSICNSEHGASLCPSASQRAVHQRALSNKSKSVLTVPSWTSGVEWVMGWGHISEVGHGKDGGA